MLLCLYEDMSEVRITGLRTSHSKSNLHYFGIHGKFSLRPTQILNWYYNNYPLKHSNPTYSIKADGLNTVLGFSSMSEEVLGTYALKIEGTSVIKYYDVSKGKLLKLT